MRKRIGAIGLAAVLLLAMICPALAAGGKAELSIKGPDGPIKTGESFTVTVEIKDNPGFVSLEFTLAFDTEVLKCTQISVGSVLADAMSASNPSAKVGAKFAAASAETIAKDGVVAELSFTAGADIPVLNMALRSVSISDSRGDELPYSLSDLGPTDPISPGGSSETTPIVSPSTPEQSPVQKPDSQNDPAPQSGPGTASNLEKENTFTDTKGHWGESFIARAAELGLFKGYPDGSFQPDLNVTRAQYVTVLYRMAGSPAVTAEAPFSDIGGQSQEFRTAIAWGYEKGYLNGKGEGVFDPAGPVTRQEAMKILFGYDGGVSGTESMFTATYDQSFTDSSQLADWGKPAMYWGIFKEIISGTSETTLSPTGTATRAQLAKILTVYYDQQKQS